jgi:hypothetical protein
MNYKNYQLLDRDVSFLILDFQKPIETKLLLESLKRRVQLEKYEVVLLSNGGVQDYIVDYYNEGFIDRLILNKKNEGCGFGTMRLIQQCSTKYFFYLQNDCFLNVPINKDILDWMIKAIEGGKVGAFDLKGTYKDGTFSESAFFAETDFYLANPYLLGGGPGVFQTLSNTGKLLPTEHATSMWLKENNKKVARITPNLFFNTGKYTIRETSCGGIILFRCDSQQLWIVKPLKQRHEDMKLTDEEWELILSGKWIGGTIPEYNKSQIFTFFGPPDGIGKPPEQFERFFSY